MDEAIDVFVQAEDFSLAEHYARMRAQDGAAIGAIAAFVGLVRERNSKAGSGDLVSTLTLEHYPGMTEQSIHAIAQSAHERWSLTRCIVVHRIGALGPEDQIVAVLVSSAHRDAAFQAAEFIMDRLKTDAVLWKKETTSEGEVWIESTADDHARAQIWQPDQAIKSKRD